MRDNVFTPAEIFFSSGNRRVFAPPLIASPTRSHGVNKGESGRMVIPLTHPGPDCDGANNTHLDVATCALWDGCYFVQGHTRERSAINYVRGDRHRAVRVHNLLSGQLESLGR